MFPITLFCFSNLEGDFFLSAPAAILCALPFTCSGFFTSRRYIFGLHIIRTEIASNKQAHYSAAIPY